MKLNFSLSEFRKVYGWKDEYKKGRTISLLSTLLSTTYGLLITGIFYTGFLSMYGIDLVGVGIVSFIPLLGSCFSLFSPMILERIQRRKWILLGSKVYFYAMSILAVNLMPLIVIEPTQRMIWFCIIQFLAYSVYSLFSTGFTPWFYAFYPKDQNIRAAYIGYNSVLGTLLWAVAYALTGKLTTLAERGNGQNTLILVIRYVAFAMTLLDVGIQALAKEYLYAVSEEKVRISDVFIKPLKHKKFMACMVLLFAWNFIVNLNSGTWSYYLLNEVGLPYSTISYIAAIYPLFLALLMPFWKKVVAKFSWIRTFGITTIICGLEYVVYFFLSPTTMFLYLPMSLIEHFYGPGQALSSGNLLYLNLPQENELTHTCFYGLFNSLFGALGSLCGTLWCKFYGETMLYIGAIFLSAVQFLSLFRGVLSLMMGIVLMLCWRSFTPNKDLKVTANAAE